jgi:hypothetical protein
MDFSTRRMHIEKHVSVYLVAYLCRPLLYFTFNFNGLKETKQGKLPTVIDCTFLNSSSKT